jgi:hypothetical protein
MWLLGLVGLLAACDMSGYESEDVGSTEHPLFLTEPKWANGVVPVCWPAATRARSDFATRSRQVRDILNASWPSVANVEFTGWGACPSNTGGLVVISLFTDSTTAKATIGYRGSTVTHKVDLGVNRPDFNGGLVPHEFGHILGFAHEMGRPDFQDDSSGSCEQDNETGDTLGTPPDRESVMASTGYCQTNRFLSRWDIVGVRNAYGTRAENVISTDSALYARKRSTGDIYRRSGSTWTWIGSPGGQFVGVGSTLYALTPDSDRIYRYEGTGTDWTQVGPAAAQILRCAGSLCRVHATSGDLYRYAGSGMTWTKIGDPAAAYASTSSKVYRLKVDRDGIEQYSGSGTTWTAVGGAAASLFATTTAVYATDPVTGEILRYSGSGTSWTVVGGEGRTWEGLGSNLYGLTPTRHKVYRNPGSGTSWTEVGGAADWIYGGSSGFLYATSPGIYDIWRHEGAGIWTNLGQP